jgi:hypothetical protein
MSGFSTKGTDWLTQGTQAVARKGYSFLLDDECNFCTQKKLFAVFGYYISEPSRNLKGEEVIVRGTPVMWFDVVPERCICNL